MEDIKVEVSNVETDEKKEFSTQENSQATESVQNAETSEIKKEPIQVDITSKSSTIVVGIATFVLGVGLGILGTVLGSNYYSSKESKE